MIAGETIAAITSETLRYWRKEVRKSEIIGIAHGKEIGHKIADLVDEKTTALLTLNHLTRHQCDDCGRKRARSMGDLWLMDGDTYHPINVKTGIVGSEGQPNLVSLKKVLSAIMARQIDSYYLLIVKMEIAPKGITSSVFFFDMLDWLDYVTFDSGPGQMMLRAVKFFDKYDPKRIGGLDIKAKVQKLMDLYEDGERRLKVNRKNALNCYKQEFRTFMAGGDFAVTHETQRSLNLK